MAYLDFQVWLSHAFTSPKPISTLRLIRQSYLFSLYS
uniref:Uncharacterized protein n=1 Tax=Anguilla anguilla TaxID=7936 RepID=A0A0E9S328_ANGAN